MDCRKIIVLALLALFTMEILPFSYREPPLMAAEEPAGIAFRFEPLQVCDQGDPFLGSMAGIPFLVPEAPVLILAPELSGVAAETRFPVPDGFKPAIDHPPRLSA